MKMTYWLCITNEDNWNVEDSKAKFADSVVRKYYGVVIECFRGFTSVFWT